MSRMLRVSGDDAIRAYLDGRLDPAALAHFECRLLDDPALLDQVQLEQALREGLRATASAPAAASHTPLVLPVRRRHWNWVALAAGFVAGVIVPGALLLQTRGELHQAQLTASRWEANPARILLELMRGSEPVRSWDIAGDARQLLIEIPVSRTSEPTEFRLRIVPHDARNATTEIAGLRPDADGIVSTLLPASVLPDGAYRIETASRADSGWTPYQTFELRLQRH